MTITAANFTVKNANAQDISNLNAALAYLSNSSDAVTVLQGMIANGTQINIIHNGDDGFVPATSTSPGVINWDPDSGSIVVNANGQMIGTQSAALGLIHEGGHATDPNLAADANTPNQQYGKRGQSHLLTMSLPGDTAKAVRAIFLLDRPPIPYRAARSDDADFTGFTVSPQNTL